MLFLQASQEADLASSVSWFFVKKLSKEADSDSFECSIFSKFFSKTVKFLVFSNEADLASSGIDIFSYYYYICI